MVNKSPKCSTWMQSQKQQNDLCSFPRQTIQYDGNPSLCPDQQCWRSWSWMVLWRPTRPFRTQLTTKKRCPFIIGDWNAKVGSQETPGVTGKFGLGVQDEAGQRWIEFFQEKKLVVLSSNSKREDSTHEHHQMVNTEIRWIIFFAAKDGEALYSQQKQDRELTVAQTMNSLLPNSDLHWRK